MDWSETIRRVVILGEATGYLTFSKINELITKPEEIDPQQIDALLSTLRDRGINIVDDQVDLED